MDEGSFGPNYRRGLVLGLTLAEIFLLLLFLLLMLSAYLLSREQEKLKPLFEVLDQNQLPYDTPAEIKDSVGQLGGAYFENAKLKQLIDNPNQALENIRTLHSITQILLEQGIAIDDPNELSTKLKAMSEAEILEEQYRRVCGDIRNVREMVELMHGKDKSAEDVLKTCPPTIATNGDSTTTATKPESLEEAVDIIDRLQRTNTALSEKLKTITGGRGLVFPPCWVRLNAPNRPVYTYNIAIFDTGLRVALGDDRTGQDLSVLKRNGPEPEYGVIISGSEFSRRTQGMFEWSVENECRFYVRIRDRTSPTNKEGYKRYLATIEDHFYKYLVLD